MAAKFHEHIDEFWQATRDLYEADPVRHTTALTVALSEMNEPRQDAAAARLVTLQDGDQLLGAALQTPPSPMLLSGVPIEHISQLASEWHEVDPGLGGAMGPKDLTEAFAKEWSKVTGREAEVTCELRLYRLDELSVPDVPGEARLGTADDIPLLAKYWLGFTRDTHTPEPDDRTEAENAVARWLALGQAPVLWELDGEPVALAMAKAPAAGMSRIGPVYTPPESRRHGYASAATAAAATWALSAGAGEVLLYTDLANPTSNSIYQQIGFRPVADYLELKF